MLIPARLAKSGNKTDKKRGGERPAGFTIVETLIVLAVTGILSASALALVSGRQNKIEFQTGINNLQQQIQQIINETQSGYYPSSDSVTCSATAGAAPTLSTDISSVTSKQGTNSGCVFIGKALRFGAGASASLQPGEFTVYPLAGTQLNSAGQNVTKPADAHATPIAPDTGEATDPSYPDLSSTNQLQNGLSFQWASYDGVKQPTAPSGSGVPNTTVFAIVTTFANYSGADISSLTVGAQSYSLYGFSSPGNFSVLTDGPAVVQTMKANGLQDAPYKTVSLCFASGTTQQSGLITIGDPVNGGLGVTTQIKDGTVC